MGRACYSLKSFFKKYEANAFFNEYCKFELTRPWHVHIDNHGNYIAGYCAGISLGDARNLTLIDLLDLEEKPIIEALVTNLKKLFEFAVKEFRYKPLKEGYISKCHLCLDIRKHIAKITDEFKELNPMDFYNNIN